METPKPFVPEKNNQEQEKDPSMGTFRFSQEERKKMRDAGETEKEIQAKEEEASRRIARDRVRKELQREIEEGQDKAA